MTPQELQILKTEIRETLKESFIMLMELPNDLSKTEAAKRLNISRPTLDKRIEQGIIATNENGRISRTTILKMML